MHVTTWSNVSHLEPQVDDTVHMIVSALITSSENELKVWGYVMTQYNLKSGLRKFGARGEKAAINKLTQLHIMDTSTVMDASRLSREEHLKALSSILFLKEKRTGGLREEHASMELPRESIFQRKRQRHRLFPRS